MLCLHAHILIESQQLNWETEMLRTLQTLQVESNSTNTDETHVTKQEMHIVCYQVWNACWVLPSMECLLYVTKYEIHDVNYQEWNACCK